MALTIPHNSRAGIAVAGGGRAANYVGAGAFMTPGQSAMPNALERLAGGIDRLDGALHEAGIERRRMRNATDLQNDELAEKDAYRAFREDYEKAHQGAGAREAAQVAEQYFQTRMDGLREKWGGNPYLMQAVERMMAPIRAGGLERAEAYSDQQEKLYMRVTSEKALGEAMLDFSDPGKPVQALGASLGGYEASLRMLHGQRRDEQTGQWVGGVPEAVDADLMQARQKLYSARADSLIAGDRLGEARAFVHANAGELGGRAGQFEARIKAAGKRLEAEHLAAVTDEKVMSFVSRLEAGEDEHAIQKEILALPKKERGAVNSLFHAHRNVWKAEQEETRQDGIIDNRLKMQDMPPGEAYRFVEGLPETTWAERKIKQQARLDYGVMASHAGLSRTTDPDAYNALVDAVAHADVKSEKDLRAHPDAVKVSKQNMDKLANDLKGVSVIQDADLKTAFRWAVGRDENSPNGGRLSGKEKTDALKFAAWANEQAKNSNRAKDPGYARELARQWRMQGDTPEKWFSGGTLGGEANDPEWLSDISEEDSRRIEALFMRDTAGLAKWRERFPQYADDPEALKRAYYRWELAKRRGPRMRGQQ